MLIGFGNHVNKGFLAVTSLINWQKNHCIIPGWHCKYSAWKEPLENISWPYPHWQANLKTTHVSQTASNPPSTAKGVGILSIHFGFVWFVSKNSDSHFPYDLLATNFGVPTQFSGSKHNELMVNIPHDVRIISPFFMVKSCYHCTQTFWKLFSSEKKSGHHSTCLDVAVFMAYGRLWWDWLIKFTPFTRSPHQQVDQVGPRDWSRGGTGGGTTAGATACASAGDCGGAAAGGGAA